MMNVLKSLIVSAAMLPMASQADLLKYNVVIDGEPKDLPRIVLVKPQVGDVFDVNTLSDVYLCYEITSVVHTAYAATNPEPFRVNPQGSGDLPVAGTLAAEQVDCDPVMQPDPFIIQQMPYLWAD